VSGSENVSAAGRFEENAVPGPNAPSEPILRCVGLRKTYRGEGAFTLGPGSDGLTLDVARGELFALVGPSGCGKTTTLGIIGGFIRPDAGTVIIDGKDVTRRPPYARPTNTVFQSYALFPHMSVESNVSFGLAMEHTPRRARRARVAEVLDLVGLTGFERRRVSELSGGQQQRAAIARALVKRPALLLLDEPMGSLDAQLRKQMQNELVRLKTTTQTTFIHVTHDQEEACAIADRMGVMKDGQLIQVGAPMTLYRKPATSYVAAFLDIGTVIRGSTARHGDALDITSDDISVRAPAPSTAVAGPVAAVIPADKVRIRQADRADGHVQASGVITRVTFTGVNVVVFVRVGAVLAMRALLSGDQMSALGATLHPGTSVALTWDPKDVLLVDDRTGSVAEAEDVDALTSGTADLAVGRRRDRASKRSSAK